MKIALIHSHLDNRGGSQRYIIEIAKNLKTLGVYVDIFSYEYNENSCYPDLTLNLNIKKIYCREDVENKNKSNVFYIIKNILRNCRVIKRIVNSLGIDYLTSLYSTSKSAKKLSDLISEQNNKYDILFAHEEPLSIYAAIKYKKINNTPIYWFCYDSIEKWFLEWKEKHYKSSTRKILLKHFYFNYDRYLINKHVDKSAVLDGKMFQRYLNLYGRTPLIRRGGIPLNIFNYKRKNKIREKFNLSDDVIIVFLLTRFVPYRRVHDILDGYIKLNDNIKEKVFIYINSPISDDSYFHWCSEKYKEIFTNNNIFLDLNFPGDDTEMYDLYLSSDIFIFPNDKQTWGHAPLEAMGCGCTTLVSTGCGISEIVKDITPEAVFEVGNTAKLASLLESLINNKSYKNISKKQRKHVKENLTWDIICKRYIDDFNEILGK